MGFAANNAEYDQSPDSFHGTVATLTTLLRYATTGQRSTPDLFDVFRILGEKRVIQRCLHMAESLEAVE